MMMILTGMIDEQSRDHSVLMHYTFAGEIVTEPPPDCPELRQLKATVEEMQKHRRPPDELVQKYLRLSKQVSVVMQRYHQRKIATLN